MYSKKHYCIPNARIREPVFNKVRVNNSYEMTRPAFRAGTVKTVSNPRIQLPENVRTGLGNRTIIRSNFTAPDIRGRDPVDFDKLNTINMTQFGNKVSLSDKTINDLLRVNLPDPTDFSWLAEKKRLEDLGMPDKLPFGRKQRTIPKRINFGQAKLDLDSSINAINQAVANNMTESRLERANLGATIASQFSDLAKINKINERQLRILSDAVKRLRLSKDWRGNGFTHRIWTERQLKLNSGPVIMFLLSNIPDDRTPIKPILSWNRVSNKYIPVGLQQLFSMNKNKLVLDLQNRALIPADEAKSMILNRGVDSGIFDDNPLGIPPPPPKPSNIDLKSFVSPELRNKLGRPSDDELLKILKGRSYEDLLNAYRKANLKAPQNLVAIVKQRPDPLHGIDPDILRLNAAAAEEEKDNP